VVPKKRDEVLRSKTSRIAEYEPEAIDNASYALKDIAINLPGSIIILSVVASLAQKSDSNVPVSVQDISSTPTKRKAYYSLAKEASTTRLKDFDRYGAQNRVRLSAQEAGWEIGERTESNLRWETLEDYGQDEWPHPGYFNNKNSGVTAEKRAEWKIYVGEFKQVLSESLKNGTGF
jgi:hypothetical protein